MICVVSVVYVGLGGVVCFGAVSFGSLFWLGVLFVGGFDWFDFGFGLCLV